MSETKDPKNEHRRALGRAGEDIACSFLQSGGRRVISRNFRGGHRELDIVCLEGSAIRFVEVKTRQEPVEGDPTEAVNKAKQMNVVRAAMSFLRSDKFKELGVSYDEIFFDVVAIVWDAAGKEYSLDYIPDAFRPIYV